jgi:segregation and condensation protein B
MDIKLTIESLLFAAGEPLSVKRLSKIINEKEEKVKEILEELKEEFQNQDRGIRLINNNEEWLMVTAPESTSFIQKLKKEVIEGDLSPASQETLAIIAYRGPITRAGINEIRGVDSSYILHQLLLRGLIERSIHTEKYKAYLYNVSFGLLQHLGISNVQELSQYEEFSKKNK